MRFFKNFFDKLGFWFSKVFYKIKHFHQNFWSKHTLIKKLLFTFLLLIIYIIGTQITIPFVNIIQLNADNNFFTTLNIVSGGGLRQFSLMALGISPFITASLIMSLLQTRLFPPIYKMTQSGPHGRKKINIITRVLTLVVAIPQAILLSQSMASGDFPLISFSAEANNFIKFGFIPLILIGGSLFALFLSEEITNKGIGNGTSLIIFSGISLGLPSQFTNAFKALLGDGALFSGIIKTATYVAGYLLLLFIIAYFYQAERWIPIQQVGAGRSSGIKEMGKLPIKVNPAGIMPIIFAFMVLSFPVQISNLLPPESSSKAWIIKNLIFTAPIGLSLLVIITVIFTILMGIQQSKVDKISEDFVKSGTFIPGIRPGEDTESYLLGIVFRLSIFSSIYLAIIASMRFIMQIVFIKYGIPPAIAFGGTGLMILVSVSIETVNQIKARYKAQKMTNFSSNIKNSNNHEGLLW